MGEMRKDGKGKKLRTGEYFDAKNSRYMFRKMVDGERVTIIDSDLGALRRKENEILYKMDRGARFNLDAAKMSLNEYFDYWLRIYGTSGRKATTCTNSKSYYNTYVRNDLGKKQMTKITKADCQKIINEMNEAGKQQSTMEKLKSCLIVVFESAIDEDIILKNPVRNIIIPRTEPKVRRAIDTEQIELFMSYIKNKKKYMYVYPAFVMLFNSGVRVGEMAAVTWKDIDFKENTIRIHNTVNRYRKVDHGFTVAIASPKSTKSVRVISMNKAIKTVLLALKLENRRQAEKVPLVDDAGKIKGYTKDLVFLNSQNRVWTEPNFLQMINRIINQYNKEAEEKNKPKLDRFCPHMIRHTYTTLLYSAGVDVKAVSAALGHASTTVTIDTYAHFTKEKKKQQEALLNTIKVI